MPPEQLAVRRSRPRRVFCVIEHLLPEFDDSAYLPHRAQCCWPLFPSHKPLSYTVQPPADIRCELLPKTPVFILQYNTKQTETGRGAGRG